MFLIAAFFGFLGFFSTQALAKPLITTLQTHDIFTVQPGEIFTLKSSTLALPNFDGEEFYLGFNVPSEYEINFDTEKRNNVFRLAPLGELRNYGVFNALGGRLFLRPTQPNNFNANIDSVQNAPDGTAYNNVGLHECVYRFTKQELGVNNIEDLKAENIKFNNLSSCILLGRNLIISRFNYGNKIYTKYVFDNYHHSETEPMVIADTFLQHPAFRVAVAESSLCNNEYLYCLVFADQIKRNNGQWSSLSIKEDDFSDSIGYTGRYFDENGVSQNLNQVFDSLPTGLTDYTKEVTDPKYAFFFPPYYVPYMTRRYDGGCIFDELYDENAAPIDGEFFHLQPSCLWRDNAFYYTEVQAGWVARSQPSHQIPQHLKWLAKIRRLNIGDNTSVAIPQYYDYSSDPKPDSKYFSIYQKTSTIDGEIYDHVVFPGTSTVGLLPHMGDYYYNVIGRLEKYMGRSDWIYPVKAEYGAPIKKITTSVETGQSERALHKYFQPWFGEFGGSTIPFQKPMGSRGFIDDAYDDTGNDASFNTKVHFIFSIIGATEEKYLGQYKLLTGYEGKEIKVNLNNRDNDTNRILLNNSFKELDLGNKVSEGDILSFTLKLDGRPRSDVILKPEIQLYDGDKFVTSDFSDQLRLYVDDDTAQFYKDNYTNSPANTTTTISDDMLRFSEQDWNVDRVVNLKIVSDSKLEYLKHHKVLFNADLYNPSTQDSLLDKALYHPYGKINAANKGKDSHQAVAEFRVLSEFLDAIYATPLGNYCTDISINLITEIQECSSLGVYGERYFFDWPGIYPVRISSGYGKMVELIEGYSDDYPAFKTRINHTLETEYALLVSSDTGVSYSLSTDSPLDIELEFFGLPDGAVSINDQLVYFPPAISTASFKVRHRALSDDLLEYTESVEVVLGIDRKEKRELSYRVVIFDKNEALFDLRNDIDGTFNLEPETPKEILTIDMDKQYSVFALGSVGFSPINASLSLTTTLDWLIETQAWKDGTILSVSDVVINDEDTFLNKNILYQSLNFGFPLSPVIMQPSKVSILSKVNLSNSLPEPEYPSLTYLLKSQLTFDDIQLEISDYATKTLTEYVDIENPKNVDKVSAVLTMYPPILASVTIRFSYLNQSNNAPDDTEIFIEPVVFAPMQTSATIQISSKQDRLNDGTQIMSIEASIQSDYIDALNAEQSKGVINEDWKIINGILPGILLTQDTKTVFTEDSVDRLDVYISASPKSGETVGVDVSIQVSQDLPSMVIDGNAFEFTNANWSNPRTVSLTFADDEYVTGNAYASFTFDFSVKLADGNDSIESLYHLLKNVIAVEIIDNDIPTESITLDSSSVSENPDGSLVFRENKGTINLPVHINGKPISPVWLYAVWKTNANPQYAPVHVEAVTLVFDENNWNQPQDVSITIGNNFIFHGDQKGTLTFHTKGKNWVSPFDSMIFEKSIVFQEDDSVSFTLDYEDVFDEWHTDVHGQTFAFAEGLNSQFSVVLKDIQPITPVRLVVHNIHSDDLDFSGYIFIFDESNWNVKKYSAITAIEDSESEQSEFLPIKVINTDTNTFGTLHQEFTLQVFDEQSVSIYDIDGNLMVTKTYVDPDTSAVYAYVDEVAEEASVALLFHLDTPDEATYYIRADKNYKITYPVGQDGFSFDKQNYNVKQKAYVQPLNNDVVEFPYIKRFNFEAPESILPLSQYFNLLVGNTDPADIMIASNASSVIEFSDYFATVSLSTVPQMPVTVNLTFTLEPQYSDLKINPKFLDATQVVLTQDNWEKGVSVEFFTGLREKHEDYRFSIEALGVADYGNRQLDYHGATASYLFYATSIERFTRLVVDTDHWQDNTFTESELASLSFRLTDMIPSIEFVVKNEFNTEKMAMLSDQDQRFHTTNSQNPTNFTLSKCSISQIYDANNECLLGIRFYQDLETQPDQNEKIVFSLSARGYLFDEQVIDISILDKPLNISQPATHVKDIDIVYPENPSVFPVTINAKAVSIPYGSYVNARTQTYKDLENTFKLLNPIFIGQPNVLEDQLPGEFPAVIPASISYIPGSATFLYFANFFKRPYEKMGLGYYFDLNNDSYADFVFDPINNMIDFVNLHFLSFDEVDIVNSSDPLNSALRKKGEFYGKVLSEGERFVNSAYSIEINNGYPKIKMRGPSGHAFSLGFYDQISSQLKFFSTSAVPSQCVKAIECSPVTFELSQDDYNTLLPAEDSVLFALGSHSDVFPYESFGELDIKLTNEPSKRRVKRGEVLSYHIQLTPKIKSVVEVPFRSSVYDILPQGFKIIEDSAWMQVGDGSKISLTVEYVGQGSHNLWKFERPNFEALQAQKIDIYYQVGVINDAILGRNESTTYVSLDKKGSMSSVYDNPWVNVVVDPLFDTSLLFGRVFVDENGNKQFDKGEQVIEGAEILMETGQIIKTGRWGRYHLAQIQDGRHIVRLDERSIPNHLEPAINRTQMINAQSAYPQKLNFPLRKKEKKNDGFAEHAFLNIFLLKPTYISFLNTNVLVNPVEFQISSNFPDLIDNWQIDVFRDNEIIRSLYGGRSTLFSGQKWDGLSSKKEQLLESEVIYSYRLLVYLKNGEILETALDYFKVLYAEDFDALRVAKKRIQEDSFLFNISSHRLKNALISKKINFNKSLEFVSVKALGYQYISIKNLDDNTQNIYNISYIQKPGMQDPNQAFKLILPKGKYAISVQK